jgi:hypothetical protein
VNLCRLRFLENDGEEAATNKNPSYLTAGAKDDNTGPTALFEGFEDLRKPIQDKARRGRGFLRNYPETLEVSFASWRRIATMMTIRTYSHGSVMEMISISPIAIADTLRADASNRG